MKFLTEQIDIHDTHALQKLMIDFATPNMRCVELGSYTGRSTLTLLPYVKDKDGMLYCVDWFRGNPGTSINSTLDGDKSKL